MGGIAKRWPRPCVLHRGPDLPARTMGARGHRRCRRVRTRRAPTPSTTGSSPSTRIKLDAATVLLQWATGGLFFLWVTSRKRVVSAGYGWLLRSIYLVMAVAAAAIGGRVDALPVAMSFGPGCGRGLQLALTVSIVRRRDEMSPLPGRSRPHRAAHRCRRSGRGRRARR